MQNVRITCNDRDVINQLNSAQRFDKGEVIVDSIQQQLHVFRDGVETELAKTPLKQTGKSVLSHKYGKMINNIRQSKKINVENFLKGNINLFQDPRLIFFEKGYKLHGRRKKSEKDLTKKEFAVKIANNKSFKGFRFLRKQVRKVKQKAIEAFNSTLKRRLEEEFKKIQK